MARELILEEKLAAIGVMVGTSSLTLDDISQVDIETTLVEAFIALNNHKIDLRLLSLIFSWIEEHGSAVIIEKLVKILRIFENAGDQFAIAGLFAKFALSSGHKGWLTIARKFTFNITSPRLLGPRDMAASLLSLRGETEWAKGSGFLVPKGAVITNSKWVLSKKSLAKLNHQYRNRLIYGSQWRADIITAYERGAKTPTEASRVTGASYEPCHRVKCELEAAGILVS